MGKYSKLIGSIVGAVVGIGVAFGVLPEDSAPQVQAALVTLVTSVFVWAFPANEPA